MSGKLTSTCTCIRTCMCMCTDVSELLSVWDMVPLHWFFSELCGYNIVHCAICVASPYGLYKCMYIVQVHVHVLYLSCSTWAPPP